MESKKSRTIYEHVLTVKRRNARKTKFAHVSSPDKLVKFMFEQNLAENRESMWLICFDTKHYITGLKLVSSGAINSSMSCREEVAKYLLTTNAQSCVFIHNHPSGNTNASQEDVACASAYAMICGLLSVEMMDFMIVGTTFRDGFTSLAEAGLIRELAINSKEGFLEAVNDAADYAMEYYWDEGNDRLTIG